MCSDLSLLSLVLLSCATLIGAEVYTTVWNMQRIVLYQSRLIQALKSSEFQGHQFVQSLIEDESCLYDRSGNVLIDPISAIRMNRRFTVELDRLRLTSPELAQLIESHAKAEAEATTDDAVSLEMPTSADLIGLIQALGRLQVVYDVSASQVSGSYFTKLQTADMAEHCIEQLRPTAYECMLIARVIRTNGNAYLNMHKSWIGQAIELLVNESQLPLLQAVKEVLSMADADLAVYSVGPDTRAELLFEALRQMVANAEADPSTDVRDAVNQLLVFETPITPTVESDPTLANLENLWSNFTTLCRAAAVESYVPQTWKSELKCEYATLQNDYYLIGPVKTEWVSLDPVVKVFYDVISESEANLVKQLAIPKFARSRVYSADNAENEGRVSKTSWLDFFVHDEQLRRSIMKVYRRSDALAQLTPLGSEYLQVVNYGLGGQFEPHFDYFVHSSSGDLTDILGNRVSTLMYYLDDVEAGGATIFTVLGFGLHPKKGSAVFWFNMHKNGNVDRRSQHSGCPVMVGNKWIVNKWHRMKYQMQTYPCDLREDV